MNTPTKLAAVAVLALLIVGGFVAVIVTINSNHAADTLSDRLAACNIYEVGSLDYFYCREVAKNG